MNWQFSPSFLSLSLFCFIPKIFQFPASFNCLPPRDFYYPPRDGLPPRDFWTFYPPRDLNKNCETKWRFLVNIKLGMCSHLKVLLLVAFILWVAILSRQINTPIYFNIRQNLKEIDLFFFQMFFIQSFDFTFQGIIYCGILFPVLVKWAFCWQF